ncbi:hypothetical protein GOODEAATRI_022620 [Goodea atripinnis]|uniref:Uncharacterized protein n=1 Tax=Goodea atripinnis TaxID=208336 RepID=A0ABV0MUB6_9TELE
MSRHHILQKSISCPRDECVLVQNACVNIGTKAKASLKILKLIRLNVIIFITLGCMVAQLVALLPCSKKVLGKENKNKKVLGSTADQGSFCMEFACSPRACMGSLRVIRLLPTVQRHAC